MTAQQKDTHFELLRRAMRGRCVLCLGAAGRAAACTAPTLGAALPPRAGNLLRLPRVKCFRMDKQSLRACNFFLPGSLHGNSICFPAVVPVEKEMHGSSLLYIYSVKGNGLQRQYLKKKKKEGKKTNQL